MFVSYKRAVLFRYLMFSLVNFFQRFIMEHAYEVADMTQTTTHNTKVSDSAYSNSSNSQSQRSSGSSKSRHSNSSVSSGYGGQSPSVQGSGKESFPQPLAAKHFKDKWHKKKKLKSSSTTLVSAAATTAAEHENEASLFSVVVAGAAALLPGTNPEGTEITEAGSEESSVSNHAGATQEAIGALPATTPGPENEGHQMAAFSFIKPPRKSKDLETEIPEETEGQFLPLPVIPVGKEEQILSNFEVEPSAKNEGVFGMVVSMQDGMVVFATPSITDVVGFPMDMWLGQSFIDFVHPKDRAAFTSHITSGVVRPLTHTHNKGGSHAGKNAFYCCLRRYQDLKSSGCCVTEKEVAYLPFQLNMTFQEFVSQGTPAGQKGSIDPEGLTGGCNSILLVITAKRVFSAYKYAGEMCVSPKFVMCHLASCQLSHVDPESIQYLGYLPQDVLGKCILEFYHPEDLPFLKEIYQTVMEENGSSFQSKPYRYKAQNGSYMLLETEWSSFVNPWSKKLEFVIGQHRVLKGPDNTDVFMAPNEDNNEQISEEVIKESKIIQEEIKDLLSEIVRKRGQIERQQVSKHHMDLANFVESVLDISKSDFQVELPQEEQSFSEHESVMLGGISPHHDHYDSKSSTETPPSYNQLNYNDNIQRFFESKPKTTLSDESGDSKIEAGRLLMSTDEDEKDRLAADSSLGSSNRKCCSPVNGSGSGSGSGHSSGSAGIGEGSECRQETSATNTSQDSYKPPVLTEALLFRHNEDMEKKMVQKHKKQRNKGSGTENKLKKCVHDKLLQEHCHGIKRNGSHSWDGEPLKFSKHPHIEGCKLNPGSSGGCVNQCFDVGKQHSAVGSVFPLCQGEANVNLWPPFSITSLQPTAPCLTHGSRFSTNNVPASPHIANMIPMYYIPTSAQQAGHDTAECVAPQEHPDPPRMPPPGVMLSVQPTFISQQVPYQNATAAALLCQYPPVYGGPPVMYPMLQPATALLQAPGSQPNIPAAAICKQEIKSPVALSSSDTITNKFQRRASQATSVKAEPGSATASLASASVKRGMSESSKKEKSLSSPVGGWTFPNVSQDDDKVIKFEDDKRDTESEEDAYVATHDIETSGDDSSYSSFYSFFKTDKSDASMKSSLEYTNVSPVYKTEEMVWEKSENLQPLKPRPVLKDPPWMEEVRLNPDLVYRYQMKDQELRDVLQADLKSLENNKQPFLVNDQLSQLYLDMELEGLSTRLKLEEGITSSSSSSGEDVQSNAPENEYISKGKRKQRSIEYGKLVMIFEENAPLPPPCTD